MFVCGRASKPCTKECRFRSRAVDRREPPGRCIPRFVFVGPSWGMHSSVCLGPPCKVINQSIVGLSPYPRLLNQVAMIPLMMELGEVYYLN
jgi:hypothetical protein